MSRSLASQLALRARRTYRKLSRRASLTKRTEMFFFAVIVGLAGGYAAVILRWLIGVFHGVFFGWMSGPLSFMGDNYVIIVPAIGGLIIGPMVYYWASEARGHGVPEVMEAMLLQGGRIRPHVALVKTIASAITIGSGGSVGREGPIIQVGSGLGSLVGQVLHLDKSSVRTLVACGGAGGIAATFNAPLAGAFFALEIILVEWTAEAFAPCVVASVTATAIGKMYFGDYPAFRIPAYSLGTYTELPLFLLLGLVCAPAAILFVRSLYALEDGFEILPVPGWTRPAIGGIFLGLVGRFAPEVFGVGYGTMQRMLTDMTVGIAFPLMLFVAKLLATNFTLSPGGSGGVFAPGLFMGSLIGAAFGHLFGTDLGLCSSSPGAYALVGMGAFFAAESHAPITSVLIVFELTGDYRLILPLMLACGIGTVVARLSYRFSIYNLKLVRRGIHFTTQQDPGFLNAVTVRQAMATDLVTVSPEERVSDVVARFDETKHHGFPVVDKDGRLHGIITIADVREALYQGNRDAAVADIATHDLVVTFPQETLNDALRKLGLRNVGRLPVVDPNNHAKLVGLITRKNIISAYNRAIVAEHTRLKETLHPEQFE